MVIYSPLSPVKVAKPEPVTTAPTPKLLAAVTVKIPPDIDTAEDVADPGVGEHVNVSS
jgi:hypothetical protein